MAKKTKTQKYVFKAIDQEKACSENFDRIETYKAIRTSIMFSAPKTDKGKVITLTSAAPGEGKTSTALNLAITFAQIGAKTLVIDADMRKSSVHRYLGLERKIGLSNILCGFASVEEATYKSIRENLDCITAGEIPPNPAELLGSDEFSALIEVLVEKYEYVIIDTPPITVVTDAMLVSRSSTGVVLVARKNMTTYKALDAAVDGINRQNVPLLGIIFIKNGTRNRKYGYNYKSYEYSYSDK